MMIRSAASRVLNCFGLAKAALANSNIMGPQMNCLKTIEPNLTRRYSSSILSNRYSGVKCLSHHMNSLSISQDTEKPVRCLPVRQPTPMNTHVPCRMFHGRNSKVNYLDFRYKLPTNHLRCHLLIIRRQKMKKHQRKKWRKKFKCVLAKTRLKREIAKEKAFRVELLTMIRRAEQFDAREYALRKLHEERSKPREKTREDKLEELKELIRVNRYQTDYIKPKHKKQESFGLIQQVHQEFTSTS